jgi:hypothetical protein
MIFRMRSRPVTTAAAAIQAGMRTPPIATAVKVVADAGDERCARTRRQMAQGENPGEKSGIQLSTRDPRALNDRDRPHAAAERSDAADEHDEEDRREIDRWGDHRPTSLEEPPIA